MQGRIRDCTIIQIDERSEEERVEAVSAAKLSELTLLYESILKKTLSVLVELLLDLYSDEAWPEIRKCFRRDTDDVVSEYSTALAGFDMDDETKDIMVSRLEDYARGVVEEKAKEESRRVLDRMKSRFTHLFTHDSNPKRRFWAGKKDIYAICETARISTLKILSNLAAIRLDGETDNIENTLVLALVDSKKGSLSVDPLASSTWEQVPASKTLITPVQCKSLWSQFLSETEAEVNQALAKQVAEQARVVQAIKALVKKCLVIFVTSFFISLFFGFVANFFWSRMSKK